MDVQLICYSVNRESHHGDYANFISKIIPTKICTSYTEQLKNIFRKEPILFLDADKVHLIYVPFILLRALFGYKNILMSVRSEELKLSDYDDVIKKNLFYALKKNRSIKILTIHDKKDDFYHKYFDTYIKDFQYWDLAYLGSNMKRPPEISDKKRPVIGILGAFNSKRYEKEIVAMLSEKSMLDYDFLISGKISKSTYDKLKDHGNCILINRFVSNEELLYLYDYSDYICCCYNGINRPSGFFGRAVQLNKTVIIIKNSYLDKYNYNYPNLLRIDKISNLVNLDLETTNSRKENKTESVENDLTNFYSIIQEW